MHFFIKSLLLSIFSLSIIHANYIDARDMSRESQKIQRLLGTLDALKINPPRNSSPNGAQIAMLSLATSGLALATISSYSHPVYSYRSRSRSSYSYNRRSNYRRRYNRYSHRNNAGVVIGATMATVGLVGVIASAAAQDNENRAYQEQERVTKEINSIISNLVITDEDYIREDNDIEEILVVNIETDIIEIDNIISNEINDILLKEEYYVQNFIELTNTLSSDLITFKTVSQQLIIENIQKMSEDNVSKSAIKELKALNKEIKSQIKQKVKATKKQLKKDIKIFDQQYEIIKEQNQDLIAELEVAQSNRILAKVDSIKDAKKELFQKYINSYINKLAVY